MTFFVIAREMFLVLGQFAIKYSKAKTKIVILTSHNQEAGNSINQTEREGNTCRRRQARENECSQVAIGFVFASDWLISWCKIFLANHKA